MNDPRRKRLKALLSKIEEALSELETIKDEEQEAFDAMPESLQSSERGEKATGAIDYLESAHSQLEMARDDIEGSMEK